jgi:hypothetical protein
MQLPFAGSRIHLLRARPQLDVSRHRSMDTLSGYIRDSEFFRDHAGTGLL